MDPDELPRLRVNLMGRMRIQQADRTITFPTRKSAALFAILLLSNGNRMARERLASALWPDLESSHARRNLSTALWRVRRSLLSTGLNVSSSASEIGLRCLSAEVDVLAFRSLLRAVTMAQGEELLQLLEAAESLYTGDLLEDMDEEWFEDERRVLRNSFADVLRQLGALLLQLGRYSDAASRFEALVRLDPLDEDAHRELMRAYHLSGRREAALRQFAFLKGVLRDELSITPAKETVALYEHIRQQVDWVFGGDRVELPVFQRPLSPDLPLVGRGSELDLMIHHLDRAIQGYGSAILISGDVGIGKSKLIQAVIEEARLRGVDVLQGMCLELETAPPYQAFLQAVWPRVRSRSTSGDRVAALINQHAESLALGLEPVRDERERAPVDSALLIEYLLGLLAGPEHRAKATMLVLEDIHRLDAATEALLLSLVGRVSAHRLFVVLSIRSGERECNRITRTLLASGVESLELHPLKKSDIPKLIESLLGRVVPMAKLADYVHEKTGGVPLLILELLKLLVAEKYLRDRLDGGYIFEKQALGLDKIRVPSRILEIVRRRILRLDEPARRLICIASVIGPEIRFELLERLLGEPEDRFIETIEALLESRLLTESGNHVRFQHESVRAAAISLLGPARLRALHLRIAMLLEQIVPGRVNEIAWHYSEGGNRSKAARFFEVAGDRARSLHANEDAARSYSNAISCAKSDASEDPEALRQLARLLLKRQEVLDLVGDRRDQALTIDSVMEIAMKLGELALVAEGMLLRSRVLCRMNRNREALDAASESERLFGAARDKRGAAMAAESTGLIYVNLRDPRRAKEAFHRSYALFKKANDRAGQARALINLSIVLAITRENRASMACLQRAEDAVLELGDKRSRAIALLQKGVLCRYMGNCTRSEALLLGGVSLMKEIGDKVGEARGRSQLACTKAACGKLREGLREAVAAVALARASNDTRAQIISMHNMASVNLRCLGLFNRAQAYLMKIIRMAAGDRELENLAVYYDSMAEILLERGDNAGALRWARQAMALHKSMRGGRYFVEDDIYLHMGLAYARLGRYKQALLYLKHAVKDFRKSQDLPQLVYALSVLGVTYLDDRQVDPALECAREVEKLMRRIDLLEQGHAILWNQYRVYSTAGARAAARRSLQKAVGIVMERAQTLRQPLRQRFLWAVRANRDILNEARRLGFVDGEDLMPYASLSRDLAMRIDQRRKAILTLISEGTTDQGRIAKLLGVSARTIRSDLAALRGERLQAARDIPSLVDR